MKINSFIRQLRPSHWAKNLLVIAPVILSHEFHAFLTLRSLGVFIVWCLCASAVYGFNDLRDLLLDQVHPFKSKRPLPAGELSSQFVLLSSFAFLFIAFGLALILDPLVLSFLMIYSVGNVLYSTRFKSVPGVDILFLTIFFLLRLVSGYALITAPLSLWLLSTSGMFFLGLACFKRDYDLHFCHLGRGYLPSQIQLLRFTGIGAFILSSVLGLVYVRSSAAQALYARPELLALSAPLILGLILRILKHRRDPIHKGFLELMLSDPLSYLFLFFLGGIFIWAGPE